MFSENIIGIYAYKDANVGNVSKLFTELKVAGRTEITYDCKKTVKKSERWLWCFEIVNDS